MKSGSRRFLCPHDKAPGACKEGGCLQDKHNPYKAVSKCPCGSDVVLSACRKCDTPGAGAWYCNVTQKRKTRCSCGDRTCGGSLCEHKKLCCNECNPIEYFVHTMRVRQRDALTGSIKSKHKMEYIGISAPDYRMYIESTFQPGMTWDNYGRGKDKWGIGHRIPLKYKNPTLSEIKARLRHENAFAQWNIDNCEQGNEGIFTTY